MKNAHVFLVRDGKFTCGPIYANTVRDRDLLEARERKRFPKILFDSLPGACRCVAGERPAVNRSRRSKA